MARPTESERLSMLGRRARVARAYCRGESQVAIAAAEQVAQSTVSTDLKWIRAEWLRSLLQDFGARKAEELAKLDHLESVAWQAWERSCQDAETLHARTEQANGQPGRTVTEKTVKGQSGDPRFLEQVFRCIDARCKVLGLFEEQQGQGGTLDQFWAALAGHAPAEALRGRVDARIIEMLPVKGAGGDDGRPAEYSPAP